MKKNQLLFNTQAGLSLNASCQQNVLTKEEVIANLILAGRSLGKGQRTVLRFCTESFNICTILNCLQVAENVWNKFLST